MAKANVLVVGGDGRANCACWQLYQSPHVGKIYCAPGNAGIEQIAELVPIRVASAVNAIFAINALRKFVEDTKIDFTFVSPELPLAWGIVDCFTRKGHKIFGPSAAAAQIETDKAFCRRALLRFNVPSPAFEIFDDDDQAKSFVGAQPCPLSLRQPVWQVARA